MQGSMGEQSGRGRGQSRRGPGIMGQIVPMLQLMRGQRVYVDTNVFIYFLEQNTEFFPAAAPVLQAMDKRDFLALRVKLRWRRQWSDHTVRKILYRLPILGIFSELISPSPFFLTTALFLIMRRNCARLRECDSLMRYTSPPQSRQPVLSSSQMTQPSERSEGLVSCS